MVAVALVDGQVLPAQYEPDRILRDDVQSLLRKVTIRPRAEFSARFPKEMPCRISIRLRNGAVVEVEKRDYEGFVTRPMRWETVSAKFAVLAGLRLDPALGSAIRTAIEDLDERPVKDLTGLLAQVGSAG
jgi:2-methylcitrate dehydratase